MVSKKETQREVTEKSMGMAYEKSKKEGTLGKGFGGY